MTGLEKTSIKKTAKTFFSLVILTLMLASFASCSWKDAMTVDGEKVDFDSMSLEELSSYVQIGQYKGVEVSLSAGQSKGEAVWNAVLQASTVKHYPETHVYYYVEQIKEQYAFYASDMGVTYKELLNVMGIDEADIISEAKEMTEKDIIYAIVRKTEGITLTDEEKEKHFSRYVELYVSEGEGGYGYTEEKGYGEEYVKTNMAEEIYGSMLYDKTTEFLIINNTFVG